MEKEAFPHCKGDQVKENKSREKKEKEADIWRRKNLVKRRRKTKYILEEGKYLVC